MHFGITEMGTRDLLLYNNVGFIPKVTEEIASKALKIAVVDIPTVV